MPTRLLSLVASLLLPVVTAVSCTPDGGYSPAATKDDRAAGDQDRTGRAADSAPPDHGAIPDFALTRASDGKTVGRAELLGSVWVADFFFTSCPGGCPIMSAHMRQLQEHLAAAAKSDPALADVKLVSITVDPANDTVGKLNEYAKRHDAGPGWWFLHGDKDAVRKLAFEGFKVSSTEDINKHSTRLMLVDAAGRLRGWYSVVPPTGEDAVVDADNFEKLKADLAAVAAGKRAD
jgi:protein SCO1/2